MSSHGDDHLDKAESDRSSHRVVKSFPKVDPSKVTTDIHFRKDLGLDSLDNVEILMALEEDLNLKFLTRKQIKSTRATLR